MSSYSNFKDRLKLLNKLKEQREAEMEQRIRERKLRPNQRPARPLSKYLLDLKHEHNLRSWAQTVADMTETEIRQEFLRITEKSSKHSKKVRDLIFNMVAEDHYWQVEQNRQRMLREQQEADQKPKRKPRKKKTDEPTTD